MELYTKASKGANSILGFGVCKSGIKGCDLDRGDWDESKSESRLKIGPCLRKLQYPPPYLPSYPPPYPPLYLPLYLPPYLPRIRLHICLCICHHICFRIRCRICLRIRLRIRHRIHLRIHRRIRHRICRRVRTGHLVKLSLPDIFLSMQLSSFFKSLV